MKIAETDSKTAIPAASARPPASGAKVLGFAALVMVLVVILWALFCSTPRPIPAFAPRRLEMRVRAGLPPGWRMKVDGEEEQTGPCIDGCGSSSLDVSLTPSDPHASRASQLRELTRAMRAANWGYFAPLTRAQALALYLQDHPEDPSPDDETIMFDPHYAGAFQGGPAVKHSAVGYDMTGQWSDGHLSLSLSATLGE